MSTKLITTLPEVPVLGFDPSLRNTGWAYIGGHGLGGRGVLQTQPGLETKGIADNIRRANEIGDLAHVVMMQFRSWRMLVAAELPAVHGHRIDSALLSSQAIYGAASRLVETPVIFINSQHAKKRITGDAKASKQKLKAAVAELVPELNEGGPFNEHIADAVAVAIVAATEYEEKLKHG